MASSKQRKPTDHVIEHARSGDSRCQACRRPIAEGELRFAEAYVSSDGAGARALRNARTPRARSYDMDDDDYRRDSYGGVDADVWQRFYHLSCAAEHKSSMFKRSLVASTLVIPEREELLAAMEKVVVPRDDAERDPATRDDYARFAARLREGFDDELALVFGDWLQSVGDPRGELIAVQFALETAIGARKEELLAREKTLLVHNPQLAFAHAMSWHRGFVRRLIIHEPSQLRDALAHPSLQQLAELRVVYPATAAELELPRTLRVLELDAPGIDVAALVATVPELEHLVLVGHAGLGISHPHLSILALGTGFAGRLAELDPKRLPALAELRLEIAGETDRTLAELARSPIVGALRRLVLTGEPTTLAPLVEAACRFDQIDLRHTPIAGRGHEVADHELDPPIPEPPPSKEWLVRHTRRPEWGIGRVIDETDAGLSIEFEHAGAKVVRNVELLIDVSR
jgi:uncharacterized protein (TIGR02996 family)